MLLIFHTKVSVTILARSRFYPQGLEESVVTKQENVDKHMILKRSTSILALQNKRAFFTVFHRSSKTFHLRMSEILDSVGSTRGSDDVSEFRYLLNACSEDSLACL